MCIEINRAKRAKEDIPVWKVMIKINGKIETPFFGTSESEFSKPASNFNKKMGVGRQYKGGYHCFLSEHLACQYAEHMNEFTFSAWEVRIVQYYIPQGELYAEGKVIKGYYGEGIDSVRARTLKLATTTNKL